MTSPLWRQALFKEKTDFPWFVQPLGLALTVVVVGFYLFKSDNYGGFTNGLRWLMWLTPIWLTCLLPIADRLGAPVTVAIGGVADILGALVFARYLPLIRAEGRRLIVAA